VATMHSEPIGPTADRSLRVSRRQLLGLAAGAAAVSACSAPDTGLHAHPAEATPRTSAPQPGTPAAAPPTAVTTPTAAPVSASAVLLCRDAWGAQPARPGGKPHTITRMTLHHSAVVLGDNRNIISRLRQDQRYHQDQLGWIDIAYHVGVDRNGHLYELRDYAIAGDTDTRYDTTGHFLVLCEGNFEQETVSEAQLQGAAHVFAWAAQKFGITSNTLAGHRDVNPGTACPGANLYSHLTSGDLKRRIDNLIISGPVTLQLLCGPVADAIVDSVEAGST
jgi:N-acetylmuramoyl-L-alanine amidase